MILGKTSSFEEQNKIAKAKRIIAEALKVAEEKICKDIIANADWSDDASIQKTVHEKGKEAQFPSK